MSRTSITLYKDRIHKTPGPSFNEQYIHYVFNRRNFTLVVIFTFISFTFIIASHLLCVRQRQQLERKRLFRQHKCRDS